MQLLFARATVFTVGILSFSLAGCEDFNEALESERNPASPPGIASADDVSDVQDASGGGRPKSDNTAGQPQTSESGSSGGGEQTQPKPGIIGKTTAKVVNAKVATQDPKVVVVENKISGSDPLTQSASAYISMTSRISTLGFEQALKAHKALNGTNPTYDEFMQMAKENRVEFTMLPPYQMYGYDEDEGKIVVLEDKAEKIRRYKEAGIPIPEEDKKYE